MSLSKLDLITMFNLSHAFQPLFNELPVPSIDIWYGDARSDTMLWAAS